MEHLIKLRSVGCNRYMKQLNYKYEYEVSLTFAALLKEVELMNKLENTLKSGGSTRFFYGWVIVAVSALGVFFSGPGQTYSVSLFINTYIDEYGWSRSLISALYSAATLGAGLLLPLIGRWVDRAGHRVAMTVVAISLGAACLWMSIITNPLMLFMGFLMIRLFGQGSMTLIPNVLVPQWFNRNRGLALSLMSLGVVAGSALAPGMNSRLIGWIGMSGTWQVWAVLLIVIMAPVAWFFVVNRPETIGSSPDGKLQIKENPSSKSDHAPVSEAAWTLENASQTGSFRRMLFCMGVPSLINTGITFHLVSIMSSKGHDTIFTASILGLTAIIQFPMTFVAGWVSDRLPIHGLKAVNFLLLLGAMGVLLMGNTRQELMLFSLLLGTFTAFDSVSSGVLWPQYFGREHLGSIRSVTMTVVVLGAALGPLPFGLAFDYFGGYSEILILMGVLPIAASLLSLFSPAPVPRDVECQASI